ncbi:MAG TPA: SseB family protein [Candidatus Binatia bacterium]|nr:SseB family protein [Candidatus Binatia bacterium]
MEPLEVAIALRGDRPEAAGAIREALESSDVYCLGQPAGHLATSQQGSESDLLHFTVDDAAGVERVMLPVFTSTEIMREALARNPDWQSLSVLVVKGGALLDHVDEDVIIVINPWSRLEYQLPPATRQPR